MIYFFKEKRLHEATLKRFSTDSLEKIGEGSYGIAYLRQNAQQLTVIKRLKAKRLNKRHIVKFNQEIAFLQQLYHLPVPKIIEVGMIDDAPFYEMTYVLGHTFEQAIFDKHARYSLNEVFYYSKQLLQIVIRIHEQHIVHRDLRIPNILISNKQLTIIDFGLASSIDYTIEISSIRNPKKVKHPISDLFEIGHFMLFLLYSNYEVTSKKSTSWRQELQLPELVQHFIERLLMIAQPFESAQEAYNALIQIEKECLRFDS